MKKALLSIIISFVLISCQKSTSLPESAIATPIERGWANAVEEQKNDGVLIYRPFGYKELPLLRYRHSFIFEQNGQGKTYVLAPHDGHYYEPISWDYHITTHTLIIGNAKTGAIRYKVLELADNILKLKQLE